MTRSLRHSGLWLFLSGVLMLSISSPTMARDESAVTLRSARAVRDAFEKTIPVSNAAGTLRVPAIVSEKLFARFFSISKNQYPNGDDAAWIKQHFALGREGIGRYFTFVADHTLIEKALIAGQFNPDQIMADVGYGTGATCSANQNYWLVVFRPKSQPVSAVYPHNLQKWFDHVYGTTRSPKISPSVVADLMSKRFSDLTECPLDSTTGAFRWSDLTQCDPIFTSIANALNQKQCANKVALRYSPTNQCPTDRVLLISDQSHPLLSFVPGFLPSIASPNTSPAMAIQGIPTMHRPIESTGSITSGYEISRRSNCSKCIVNQKLIRAMAPCLRGNPHHG